MATISNKQAVGIIGARAAIAEFARNAVEIHADSVRSEVSGFDTLRDADANSWAKLTIIKAILSPGANLDKNITLAKVLHAKMLAGWVPLCYDDVEPIRADCKYGARSGANITHLVAAWQTIRTIDADSMNYEALTALNEANLLPGMGSKVRSWAIALYDADSEVCTLDVHMLRGMLRLAGMPHDADSYGAKGAAYEILAAMMVSIAEELGVPPLVMQWAMWNEFRHAGTHASHAALSA
jgi:hypothetical protein